jgi:hypothetical protein
MAQITTIITSTIKIKQHHWKTKCNYYLALELHLVSFVDYEPLILKSRQISLGSYGYRIKIQIEIIMGDLGKFRLLKLKEGAKPSSEIPLTILVQTTMPGILQDLNLQLFE